MGGLEGIRGESEKIFQIGRKKRQSPVLAKKKKRKERARTSIAMLDGHRDRDEHRLGT